MTHIPVSTNRSIAALPPILDLRALEANFAIGRTTAYHLATAGEITSVSLGAPGRRGRRRFLTQSVLDYISRRAAETKPLNCGAKRKGNGPNAPIIEAGKTQRNTNNQGRH